MDKNHFNYRLALSLTPIQTVLLHPLSLINRITAFLIGYIILFMGYSDSVNRQWDFPVYYLAAHTIWDGKNPYDPPVLQTEADSQEEVGYGGGLPYLYPPHLARLLYPLVKINFFTASFLWMAIKCFALESILYLTFLLMDIPITPLAWILGHIAALFFRPITLDFSAGNVAIFESALILGGLAAWKRNNNNSAGFLTMLGGSLKGSSSLIFLYPLHLRDIPYLRTLICSALLIGSSILLDWRNLINFIAFFQSSAWQLIWDEQVQSYYNCSSVTVLLRTFCETYFAAPLIHCPFLAKILIPWFPIAVFTIIAVILHRKEKEPGFDKTSGILLSMILCGVLLLPPRLAGYTLVWTLFPVMQIVYTSWKQRSFIILTIIITGFTLIQLNLPPNHIPAGISQLLIDKDFFGLLLFFFCASALSIDSRKDNQSTMDTR